MVISRNKEPRYGLVGFKLQPNDDSYAIYKPRPQRINPLHYRLGEKGRDLTQSYDKHP